MQIGDNMNEIYLILATFLVFSIVTGCNETEVSEKEYEFSAHSVFYECTSYESPCSVTNDIEIGDKIVSIKHGVGMGEFFYTFAFSFDDKPIFGTEMIFSGMMSIGYYSYDDMFVVDWPDGLDHQIYFYDKSGNKVYEFPYPPLIYEIDGDSITFEAATNSRFYSNFCDDDESLNEYGYDMNTIGSKVYEMKYLGNQKFSTPIVTEEITFSQSRKECY